MQLDEGDVGRADVEAVFDGVAVVAEKGDSVSIGGGAARAEGGVWKHDDFLGTFDGGVFNPLYGHVVAVAIAIPLGDVFGAFFGGEAMGGDIKDSGVTMAGGFSF